MSCRLPQAQPTHYSTGFPRSDDIAQTRHSKSQQRVRSGRSRFLLAFIHSSQKGRCLLGRRQGRAAVTATACNTRTHRGCNRRPNPNCSFLKVLQSIRSATPTELVRSAKLYHSAHRCCQSSSFLRLRTKLAVWFLIGEIPGAALMRFSERGSTQRCPWPSPTRG